MLDTSTRTILEENFSDFPVGHVPFNYTPVGEYHYKPPKGYRGQWYEPTNRGWRLGGHWLVLEEDGEHFLEQTTNQNYLSMLVAGDTAWEDYTLRVNLRPLNNNGEVGVQFRYQTGRRYYALFFTGGNRLQLVYRCGAETVVLVDQEYSYSCDARYQVEVRLVGNTVQCLIDGASVVSYTGLELASGKIGLAARVPMHVYAVEVKTPRESQVRLAHHRRDEEYALAQLRHRYPQPKLWRSIDLKGFGAGRHIRWGDLTGNGELDFVLAQNVKHHGIDLYSMIRCLTAFDIRGRVLWQYGEPGQGEDAAITTSDLAFQVYDIDGDGAAEVILMRNFKIIILDGATGKVKRSVPTPHLPRLTQATCYKWPESEYDRINGDAIIIANLSGNKRPQDLLIKSRYNFVWAYNHNLEPLWRVQGNTGHFPQPYDFNGDGRDEVVMGWSLLSADGKVLWDLALPDHVDEIAIGAFNPALVGPQIALVGGDDGFIIVSPEGKILQREMIGHAQRVTAAKFRADLPGLQFYVTTFWDNAGILSLHDCTGKKIFDWEPTATGNIMNPVNWTGDGTELALLSGSQQHGGLVDGYGRRVVLWPNDGHPELAAEVVNLTGDVRDEIALWDTQRMNIYTQDTEPTTATLYQPRRYPHYNNSNYRAEISLPN